MKKAIITYLDEEHYYKLVKMAEKKGSSVSQVVREILLNTLGDKDGKA